MTNFKNNDFESVMLGRHSVRKFDTSVKIQNDKTVSFYCKIKEL